MIYTTVKIIPFIIVVVIDLIVDYMSITIHTNVIVRACHDEERVATPKIL
jgi:hypothetical protein